MAAAAAARPGVAPDVRRRGCGPAAVGAPGHDLARRRRPGTLVGARGVSLAPGGPLAEERLDELVEVPVEDAVHVARLQAGPVVLDHLVRVQHVGTDLRPEVDVL